MTSLHHTPFASDALLAAAAAAAPIIRRMVTDGRLAIIKSRIRKQPAKASSRYGRAAALARELLDRSAEHLPYGAVVQLAETHGLHAGSLTSAFASERRRRGLPTARPGTRQGYRSDLHARRQTAA